ncbi:MAG: helix-turn-helix domain-containing protein [Verrucomicrobiales bacterium]
MNSHRFNDFDAFAESVRGVECQMMLQNPEELHWSVDSVSAGQTYIQLGRLGSGNIVEGQSRSDNYLIYLPLSDECEYAANGETVGVNSFAILEPGSEFCISTKTAHDWCAVHLPTGLFTDHCNANGSTAASRQTRCRVTAENPQLADRVKLYVNEIIEAARACPQFETENAAIAASAALRDVGSAVIGQPLVARERRDGRPKISRQKIIDRSMALVKPFADEPVTVGQMAAAAEVSERTLETAFKEYFSATPTHYLQLRQLHQISRALKEADPGKTSVTDVLTRHGVWQFGRFAARYRRLFGELPSETLRKRRR